MSIIDAMENLRAVSVVQFLNHSMSLYRDPLFLYMITTGIASSFVLKVK